jgi:cytochrome b561
MNAQANEPGDVLRYAGPAIALHWAMAILVLVAGVLALLHDSWPKRTQGFWINLHALLSLLVLVLLLARLWWRGAHTPLAYALFALIGIHSAAAIWHQLYRRDRVMSRMWPPKRQRRFDARQSFR